MSTSVRPSLTAVALCLPLLGLMLPLPGCAPPEDTGLPAPIGGLPVDATMTAGVTQPVDIVRDEYGVPHIYAQTLTDAAYAQGYVMAQDRLVQMDLFRHFAAGTLAELYGALDESYIDQDIALRVHHMQATAQTVWDTLRGSQADDDKTITQVLQHFSAGVNAYIDELKRGDSKLPAVFALAYDASTTAPWTPVDSLVIARLQAFELSYDADSELARTQAEAAAFHVFDQSGDPALRTRRGLASDLFRIEPLDPAAILPDATSCGGGATTKAQPPHAPATTLYDFAGLSAALTVSGARLGLDIGLGLDHRIHRERGSNNWIVAPAHTSVGHALVANDTHLSLSSPPIFYLQHISVAGDLHLMGVQFAGLPSIVLGMNDRLAWGATVTYADVTDLYEEQIQSCNGDPCVMWHDPASGDGPATPVMLQKRVEAINVGRFGKVQRTQMVTLWDVPQHGPILPHITASHDTAPLSPVEISVRYTGHQPTYELRAVTNLALARTVQEGMAAIERDFSVGGQNWVMGDADGHIGWTTHVNLPVRPPGSTPWIVMPGDGSAEWQKNGVPAMSQPRAYDPSCGLLVSANNDPLGATRDGAPKPAIYHGWNYDPGARAGRITALLRQGAQSPGLLDLPALQQIQADHTSFLGKLLLPVLRAAGADLLTELGKPGTFPDLSLVAMGVDAPMKARLQAAAPLLAAWQLATPSGLDNEASPGEVSESVATTIFHTWLSEFHTRTLEDEFSAIDAALAPQKMTVPRPDSNFQRKLLVTAALTPEQLTIGREPGGDSLIFDDLRTPARIETRREIAAAALVAALGSLAAAFGEDPMKWQWGRAHRLTLDPLLPLPDLAIPNARDPQYPMGVPRHGDVFSVDAAAFGVSRGATRPASDFTYNEGPAIRFVSELAPDGPHAFNVLPGGQIMDPDSPHFADQFALWRHNQAFALPFRAQEVADSAGREAGRGLAVRVRLTP